MDSFKYRKAIIKFFVLFLFFLGCSTALNMYLIKNGVFCLKANTKSLITGSSFVANGLDPNFIFESQNIGMDAEPIFISFYKLKYILKRNKNVKNVVVSFSVGNLEAEQDIILQGNNEEAEELIHRLLNLPITINELRKIGVNKILLIKSLFRERIFPNFKLLNKFVSSKAEPAYIGHFTQISSQLNNDVPDDFFVRMREHFFPLNSSGNYDYSIKSCSYLDSIVNFTEKNDINLYLVTLPVYPKFYNEIPTFFKEIYNNKLGSFKVEGVIEVDFTGCFTKCEYFSDFAHLNKYGAKKISIILNDIINEKENNK